MKSEDKVRGLGADMERERRQREDAEQAAPVLAVEENMERELHGHPRNLAALAVRYLLPLAFTVVLLWYMFRKVDFASMMAIVRQGVNLWWILLAMGISILSHVSRAVRWRMQLRSMGIHAPLLALCCSIFGCYALNLVFPRLGELWRCTYIARRQKAPFTAVLGSVVSDRLTDTVMVLCLMLLTFIVANSAIRQFLAKYPVGQDLLVLAGNPWVWVALAVTLFLVGCVFYFGRGAAPIRSLLKWLHELWLGFASLWRMQGKWKFLLLTLAIWGCYFMQLYVAFFAFDFTAALYSRPGLAAGFVPALVAFVFGAIGMAIPSNGGLGPWNIATMFGLAIYGITDAQGSAFSMVQWSGQTVMLILLGIFTMIYISIGKPSGKASVKTR